jgi:hypothetical protein
MLPQGEHMRSLRRFTTGGVATSLLIATAACGSLGNVLGGVLGSGQSNQVSGYVEAVSPRTQQLAIQTRNGQRVVLLYDNQTSVVYQNQNYPVTALERGDEVTARVQSTNSGDYYTDLIQVDRSVSAPSSASGNVVSLQGTVGQIDRANGLFRLDGNNRSVIVSMPYNVRASDRNILQNLRIGDRVRFYGVFLNNERVELRQFY